MPRRRASVEPRPSPPAPGLLGAARRGGFHTRVGFRLEGTRGRAGRSTVVGRVEPRHLNINRVVHGGVYATILDTAMGGAVVSLLRAGEATATASIYVEFLRAARLGDVLRARGHVLRRGRHLAFVEGELVDRAGRLLSQAHGTWYIWSSEARRSGRPGRRSDSARAGAARPTARKARAARAPS